MNFQHFHKYILIFHHWNCYLCKDKYKNFRDKELSNLSEVAKNNVNNNDSNDLLKLEVY